MPGPGAERGEQLASDDRPSGRRWGRDAVARPPGRCRRRKLGAEPDADRTQLDEQHRNRRELPNAPHSRVSGTSPLMRVHIEILQKETLEAAKTATHPPTKAKIPYQSRPK
jgi:hypothetical protein